MKANQNDFGRGDGLPILTPDSAHPFAVLELKPSGFSFPPEDLRADCGVIAKIVDDKLGRKGGPGAYPERDLIYLIEQCDLIALDVPAAVEEGLAPSAAPVASTFFYRLVSSIKTKGTVLSIYIERSRTDEWLAFIEQHVTPGTFVCVMDHEPVAYRASVARSAKQTRAPA